MKLYKLLISLFFVLLLILLSNSDVLGQLILAFPGAEGYGAFTPGGRGGKVLIVTTLEDYDPATDNAIPGSFRLAVDTRGPRIIVFRVSGYIDLKTTLSIREPYVTIAGQTAPGDGICLRGYETSPRTHDIIIRYMRFRTGDEICRSLEMEGKTEALRRRGPNADGLELFRSHNVIVDHCSVSWSIDEAASVYNCSSVTVQWCIVSESLHDSYHRKGPHGMGAILGGWGISYHHNILAHHNARSPRPSSIRQWRKYPSTDIDFRNNVVYNWGSVAGYNQDYVDEEGVQLRGHHRINYVNNYFKPGPSTRENQRGFFFRIGNALTRMYLEGNFLYGFPEKTENNWLAVIGEEEKYGVNSPFPSVDVSTDDIQKAYKRVLAGCGAVLPARDAVDERIINDIRNGTGGIINSQREVGGWPELKKAAAPKDSDNDGMPDEWELKYGLNPHYGSDYLEDIDRDGYTNIEEFINFTNPITGDTE